MRITFDEIETLAESSLNFYELCERYPRTRPLRVYQERDRCVELSPDDLLRRVQALGSRLQRECEPQQRVMLLLPAIEDFVVGLLACFHANVVAVPTVVDAAARTDAKAEMIAAVLSDSGACRVLADEETRHWLEGREALASAGFLTVSGSADGNADGNADGSADGEPPLVPARSVARDDLAMMMYTSGSTSLPKGVMINHRTLVFQAAFAAVLWEIDSDSTVVSWLALTHNFGLPLGLLVPLLTGASTVLLAPELFIRHPGHWFELIARHGGTHAGATNSALDHCVESVDVQELTAVSLAGLTSVFCAGEPIRELTVSSFTETFAALGLRSDAVRPHYGLTEIGCMATESSQASPTVLTVDAESLGHNRVVHALPGGRSRSLLRNGRVRGPVRIEIVDPRTAEPCPEDRVGEVWFKSTGTCQGYHGRPEENAQTFGATIATTGEGGFFRTGDLGFVQDGHLYLVGRVKELLIVNGMKFHPPDLETTIRKRIPELKRNAAVFPVEGEDAERIVLVQELAEPLDTAGYRRLVRRLRAVISDHYGISLHDIVFTAPGSIPRSGIGKVKRSPCRDLYLAGELPVWFRLRHGEGSATATPAPAVTEREVRHRLAHEVVAPALSVEPSEVLQAASLGELGCTSVQYIQLAKRIEEVFRVPFTPARLFTHNQLADLTAHLARKGTGTAGRGGATARRGGATAATAPAAGPDGAGTGREPTGTGGPVAIIGVACRFPGGATDPDAFWHNLRTGKDSVTRIGDSRPQLVEDHLRNRGDLTEFPQFAGFTDGVEEFDAAFFGIAPLEAQSMDPQQRRLMELTWHLLEDSGHRPSRMRGRRVGVYVGAHGNDYAELLFNRPELVDTYGAYMDSGTHPALLANRVSRWYDFRGPSKVFNTACSSSLVALGAAVADLRAGVCSEAVVGGVNTLLSARSFHCNLKAGMQAGDGRCKTFDARADGYVRAEGYGAVLLKPLADAERDGDRIHGVIRGTAVNHDGRTDSLRAPNPAAQTDLITAAYSDAGVAPRTVGYVEAHGTGTALGDPIEVQALVDAFHALDPDLPAASCGLGSVKTNIGHLESAAGLAGLIKVLLCMRHERIPGLLHFQKLNPFIELEETPFRVVARDEPWERGHDEFGEELPLRAAVSSFGFGGANAHVILEEYRRPGTARDADSPEPDRGPSLILVSARNEDRLQAQAERLLHHLDAHPADLETVAGALRHGREEMPERLAFVATGLDEAKDKLRRYLAGERSGAGLFTGNTRRSRDFAAFFGEDEELRRCVEGWLASGGHAKVLDLWVKGVAVDWAPLDEGGRPAPVSLPPYPFAPERHWFTDTFGDAAPVTGAPARGRHLHPLLQENVSDFTEQRFRSHWTGQEFFLRDHVVHGLPSLPAAAWLEAARAAVALAHGAEGDHAGVRMTDLAWDETYRHRPGATRPTDVSLMPDPDGLVDFDCYRQPAGRAGDVHLYCQGRAELLTPREPDRVEPRRFTDRTETTRSPSDIEADLARAGVRNGPAYQALTALRQGRDHWVAELSLPGALRPTAGEFVAHPVLLTAALQAAALRPGRSQASPTDVSPFPAAMDEAVFLARCDGDAYAVITERAAAPGPHGTPLVDIDMRDAEGGLLARLSGIRFADRIRSAEARNEGSC